MIDIPQNIANDRFASFVGIKLLEVGQGHALAQLSITNDHLNGINLVQGGAIFTLADYAFAAAANYHGLVTVGINATISYFKPPKGQVITAEAKEVSTQKRLCTYNVDIFDESKELVARLTATGYIKR